MPLSAAGCLPERPSGMRAADAAPSIPAGGPSPARPWRRRASSSSSPETARSLSAVGRPRGGAPGGSSDPRGAERRWRWSGGGTLHRPGERGACWRLGLRAEEPTGANSRPRTDNDLPRVTGVPHGCLAGGCPGLVLLDRGARLDRAPFAGPERPAISSPPHLSRGGLQIASAWPGDALCSRRGHETPPRRLSL